MAASANIPELVIGEPVTVNAEGAVKATEVTVPVPVYSGIFNIPDVGSKFAAPEVPVVVMPNTAGLNVPSPQKKLLKSGVPVYCNAAVTTGVEVVLIVDALIKPSAEVAPVTSVTVPVPEIVSRMVNHLL